MTIPRTIISTKVPPPVGGINARDPLDLMQPTDAVELRNFFPEAGKVVLRKGYEVQNEIGGGIVASLMPYVATDGTKKLIAINTDFEFYDVTTQNYPILITNGAADPTSYYYSWTNFKSAGGTNYLLMTNGEEGEAYYFDGTDVDKLVYSGGVTKLNNVTVYKERLYFSETDTTSFWYGVTGEYQGALTEYSLDAQFKLGGYISWLNSWGRDTGSGLEDLFVCGSSEGEVLVFSGDDPSSNFSLVGRYFLSPPLGGSRGVVKFGADLLVLTESGVISLTTVISQDYSAAVDSSLTSKIQDKLLTDIKNHKDSGGWELFISRPHKMLIINIASVSNGHQYVMNINTGAWCEFTGVFAHTFALLDGELYAGGDAPYGYIFKLFSVSTEPFGRSIDGYIKHSFNYLGDESRIKSVCQIKPIALTSATELNISVDVDVDFDSSPIAETATLTSGTTTPWGSSWGSPWSGGYDDLKDSWFGVGGTGRAFSIKLQGYFNGIDLSFASFYVYYEPGGIL